MTERCHLGTSTRHYLRSIHHSSTVHGLRSGRNCLWRPVRFGCTVDQRRCEAGRTGRQLHRRPSEGAHGSQIGAHAGLCGRSDDDGCSGSDRPTDQPGGPPTSSGPGACPCTGAGTSASSKACGGPGAYTEPCARTDHCSSQGQDHRATGIPDVDGQSNSDDRQHLPAAQSSAPQWQSAAHYQRRRLTTGSRILDENLF